MTCAKVKARVTSSTFFTSYIYYISLDVLDFGNSYGCSREQDDMAAVQLAKKELRRKIQNVLKELPRESVNAQCSDA